MRADPHVLIWSASYGGGHGRAADAFRAYLEGSYEGRVKVTVVDAFDRYLPRTKALAAVAYRNSSAFFPDGVRTLAELSVAESGDPVVREMVAGGLAGIENALAGLRPDAVVSFHPLAAGLTAEAKGDAVAISVLTDGAPVRSWTHPGTDLTCVADPDARTLVVAKGVAWDDVAVTGVPAPPAPPEAGPGGKGSGRPLVALFPAPDRAGASRAADELARRGLDTWGAGGGAGADDGGPSRLPDVAVAIGGGSALWVAPAWGVPLVILEPVHAQEVANVDRLVNLGAALTARDVGDLVSRVEFLLGHAERLERMAAAASRTARPNAAASVAERMLALID